MVVIENAQKKDLDRLMELEEMAFPPEEAAVRDTFAYRLDGHHHWFFKAVADGEIVSYATCREVDIAPETGVEDWMYECEEMPSGKTLILQAIGTHQDFQKQGIAGRVLEHMIAKSREKGIKRIVLACKDFKVHYYAKFGFEKMGLSVSQHGGAVWYDMEMKL